MMYTYNNNVFTIIYVLCDLAPPARSSRSANTKRIVAAFENYTISNYNSLYNICDTYVYKTTIFYFRDYD